jgi:RecJ-like exonuclease
MVDGDDLDMVVFIDQLDKAKPIAGGKKLFKYTVSDESGSIELTCFVPQGKESPLTVGTVVNVIGAVNTFNGKNSIRLKSSKVLTI